MSTQHRTWKCSTCGLPLFLMSGGKKWACGKLNCSRYGKLVRKQNTPAILLGVSCMGPARLNQREQAWMRAKSRDGRVKCGRPGCTERVKKVLGKTNPRCSRHTPKVRGRLTAEDLHLLDLSKDAL